MDIKEDGRVGSSRILFPHLRQQMNRQNLAAPMILKLWNLTEGWQLLGQSLVDKWYVVSVASPYPCPSPQLHGRQLYWQSLGGLQKLGWKEPCSSITVDLGSDWGLLLGVMEVQTQGQPAIVAPLAEAAARGFKGQSPSSPYALPFTFYLFPTLGNHI